MFNQMWMYTRYVRPNMPSAHILRRFQIERKISPSNYIACWLQGNQPIACRGNNIAGGSQDSLQQIPFLGGFNTTEWPIINFRLRFVTSKVTILTPLLIDT